MFSRIPPVVFFAPDDSPGSANPNQPTVAPHNPESIADAVKKAMADILGSKGNDPMAALETLIKRNHALEVRADKAEEKVREMQKQLPDETAQKAAADKLAAYEALGKPDELKAELETGRAAIGKAARFERDAAIARNGDDPAKVAALRGVDEWVFEQRDATDADGKPVKVDFVKFADAEGKSVEKPYRDAINETFPSLADSLKAGNNGATTQTQGAQPVTTWGKSAPLGGGKPTTVWDKMRDEKRREREAENSKNGGGAKSWQEQVGVAPPGS